MATYTETASGGIEATGCTTLILGFSIAVDFAVGDVGFVEDDARRRGKLTPVVIKRVVADPNRYITTKVVDTFNGIWFEDELVNHSTAIALATAYAEAQQAKIQAYLDSLC